MLKQYVHKIESNKSTYISQYKQLPKDMTNMDYIIANLNSKKNNFHNILAAEETRVKSDYFAFYINANHILDNYIATQQPNENTYNEFWEMIYNKKCSLIVNLSGNNNYLPMTEAVYGKYKVTVENITDKYMIKIRNIHISKIDEECDSFVVYHATFHLWPDFGIPSEEDFNKLFDAINMIDYMSIKRPIVVHCRAGVGRTGTFILVHYILKKINENILLDPMDVLIEMRRSRCNMVQEACQFEFALNLICHKVNERLSTLLIPKQNSRSKLSSSCGEEEKLRKIKIYANIKPDKKLSSSTELSI
ncbi:protein-tyrosine phosphatase [Fadolivirus algeromassiliense]|jgi:tyrosine-protein phosphatase non-receptor type 9|uniref:Protein-tyrosine phosphatase n=1 Tax=Fadolivirus FV1/VV64 TaxID=3070911 RepID=A0A7D3QUM2_9VIRU|nr:protein-tyrosine phosphatase [Fadolivirus algeromassiliense]QKF94247.1 protein-tyrosine phosphatase [Fadolivirus FV1/VV64]